MDREKEMFDLFQSAIDGRNCSYHDFRLLMENLSLNGSNRKRKAKQAVRFLCEKPDAAFVDGKDSLRELKRLDQCPSVLARLEQILKDGEELLKSMLPEIFQPDSPEAAAMRQKFMDALQAEMQRRARDAGEKLYRRQQYLLLIQKEKQEEIQRILQIRYMEEFSILTTDIHLSLEEQFKYRTLAEFEYRLKMWREEQIEIVEKELLKLIPNEKYYCEFSGAQIKIVTPEDGRKQAKELACEIVDLVYDLRLEKVKNYHGHPLGWHIGNYASLIPGEFGKRQIQCDQWTLLFYKYLQDFICNWFFDNNNSFKFEWYRKPPVLVNYGEHNLCRILGPDGKSCIYIDPWSSGGREIIRRDGDWNKRYEVFELKFYPNMANKKNIFPSANVNRISQYGKFPRRDRKKPVDENKPADKKRE